MTKTDLLQPKAQLIQAIHHLTLSRVAWIAKYIAYRGTDQIVFGKETFSVAEFCKKFEGFNAGAFRVRAWSGAPGKQDWLAIPMTCVVVDWYFQAIVQKNRHMIRKLEEMLLEKGDY